MSLPNRFTGPTSDAKVDIVHLPSGTAVTTFTTRRPASTKVLIERVTPSSLRIRALMTGWAAPYEDRKIKLEHQRGDDVFAYVKLDAGEDESGASFSAGECTVEYSRLGEE